MLYIFLLTLALAGESPTCILQFAHWIISLVRLLLRTVRF